MPVALKISLEPPILVYYKMGVLPLTIITIIITAIQYAITISAKTMSDLIWASIDFYFVKYTLSQVIR